MIIPKVFHRVWLGGKPMPDHFVKWGEGWLAKHPGPVVASNQATDRICKLYRNLGFQLRLFDAPRLISCTGDRTPAKEMLATKGLQN